MNIHAGGYFDSSEEEGSEYESGFSENSDGGGDEPIPSSVALQKAIQEASVEDVELIVSEVADYASFTLNNGQKPLVFAASLSRPLVVDFLLKCDASRGIRPEVYASFTPLMAACAGATYADQEEGEEEEKEEEEEDTVAGRCTDDRVACIELILDAGHDVNFKDRYGETALMRACRCAPLAAVRTLLRRDADVNMADNEGWSPLFYATVRGHLRLVRLLLEHGADAARVDKRGRRAYTIALEKGFARLADVLETPNAPDARRPSDSMAALAAVRSSSVFDEEDAHYRGEVLEMVAAASASTRRNVPAFAEKRLALRDFLLLKSDQELRLIGVPFSGHRKKILARIKQFHLGAWLPAQSLGFGETLFERGELTGLFNFAATLHRQLYVLAASLRFVQSDTAKLKPEDAVAAVGMLECAKRELLQLNKRLAALKLHLDSVRAKSVPYLTAEEV